MSVEMSKEAEKALDECYKKVFWALYEAVGVDWENDTKNLTKERFFEENEFEKVKKVEDPDPGPYEMGVRGLDDLPEPTSVDGKWKFWSIGVPNWFWVDIATDGKDFWVRADANIIDMVAEWFEDAFLTW